MQYFKKLISCFSIIYILGFSHVHSQIKNPKVLQKIAFGSCARQENPQLIWDTIVKQSPDLFLFIGDNIYGDSEDMEVLKQKYAQLAAKTGYQKLQKTCPILSVWDDHDYGQDDGGKNYSKKKESQQVFLDFFKVEKNSIRRKREGIYDSKIFGTEGKKVQIILLDTRYFKDAYIRNMESWESKQQKKIVGMYLPNYDTSLTMLGKAQWNWLEGELQKPADLRIIVSSIQVISYEKGMECWGDLPMERKRLFDLIKKTKAKGVMFISGDVHFSEISLSDEGPYPLYDFTSSGLTNTSVEWANAVNSFRVGNACADPNFGLINIDWNSKDPVITMQTISLNNKVRIEKKVLLSELREK